MNKPLSVYDVCPDTVDTDMSKGLWEEWPKLNADWKWQRPCVIVLTSTFNVNKIVIQKNAH
jgi:hypothetical protein